MSMMALHEGEKGGVNVDRCNERWDTRDTKGGIWFMLNDCGVVPINELPISSKQRRQGVSFVAIGVERWGAVMGRGVPGSIWQTGDRA